MTIKELESIKNLIFFDKEILRRFNSKQPKTLDDNILEWLKAGKIISLKKGLYITKDKYLNYKGNIKFFEFLSSIIKYPSYLSETYVLRKYNVLTDATYGFSAVTLKTGSWYKNKLGTFSYKNIKKELFIGFDTEYFLDHEYLIAKKSKALFDYLYFASPNIVIPRNIDLVEELRLNLDEFKDSDFKELEKFAEISKKPKMKKIIKNIIKNAPNNK